MTDPTRTPTPDAPPSVPDQSAPLLKNIYELLAEGIGHLKDPAYRQTYEEAGRLLGYDATEPSRERVSWQRPFANAGRTRPARVTEC